MRTTDVAAFRRFEHGGRLVHLPALDGLRGIAVAAVVCFHGNWRWMGGGFVGVSVFFTLSGFLICSLLLAEHRNEGSISLGRFWVRRFGRLLPAAWLTIAATSAGSVALERWSADTRGDAIASLAQVANWRFLVAGSSYADIFAEPSPLRHFWSLAIEEQIYLVVPLVVAAVLASSRRRRGALLAAFTLLCVPGVVVSVVSDDVDRIYYGTDTRAPELLLGALAAVAVASPRVREWLVAPSGRPILVSGSVLAFAAVAYAAVVIDPGSSFVRTGGMVLIGVASVAMVLAAAAGVGPVAALCRLAPLRWLGRVSYGVYLFHWPLMVLLTERRTGLERGPRFALVVAISLLAAEASHRWFETPLRRRILRGGAGVRLGQVAACAAVVVLVAALPTRVVRFAPTEDEVDEVLDLELARFLLARAEAEPGVWGRLGLDTPRFAIVGDSVAFSLGYQLSAWSNTTHEGLYLGGDVRLGCGIGRGGWEDGVAVEPRDPDCDDWPRRWDELTRELPLDLVVVHTGQWEIVDRRMSGDDSWRRVGDPLYDRFLLDELAAAQEVLSRRGALVVWVNLPHYGTLDTEGQPDGMRRSHEPGRVDRFNDLLREHVDAHRDDARLLDLASWMRGRIDDTTLRPDGSHFAQEPVEEFALGYLGPELLDIWRSWRSDTPATPDTVD